MDRTNIPDIAEVFEDLATEVANEIVVLEDFVALNPDVTRLSNVSPGETSMVDQND